MMSPGKTKTTFVLGVGEPDSKPITKALDDDGSGSYEVSDKEKEAALDVAEALGLDREKIDGETLAMALCKFFESSDEGKGGDDDDDAKEGLSLS